MGDINNLHDPFTYIGFLGALLVLFGFYRTSVGRWTNKSFLYELDNLIGASLIVVYQLHYRIYATIALNIVWVVVAFRGIASLPERRFDRQLAKGRRKS